MRRVLGFVLVAGLFIGGAAGCSSDSDGAKKADTTVAEKGATGDDGGSDASNPDVAAYCDAVDAYVAKVQDVKDDPSKAGELSKEATELSDKAVALATAGLSADDSATVGECTKRSTEALTAG